MINSLIFGDNILSCRTVVRYCLLMLFSLQKSLNLMPGFSFNRRSMIYALASSFDSGVTT